MSGMMDDPAVTAAIANAGAAPDEQSAQEVVPRTAPTPDPARAALVKKWTDNVVRAREKWEPAFKRMREDMLFAAGVQWEGQTLGTPDDRYIANITLRHISQRTATLYARNPRVVARRKPRLLSTVWDGTMQQLAEAQAILQADPMNNMATAIIQDAMATKQHNTMLDRVGRTLELLYQHELSEQVHPFKAMMKMTVRRSVTAGVGWVKLGFQRVVDRDPQKERQLADMVQRLQTIERLAADLADKKVPLDNPEAEQLRLAIQGLESEAEIIVREGLTFDWPDSTAIIPDTKCRQLREFLGCDWVAEQFMLTPEEVQETYGVDVRTAFVGYVAEGQGGDTAAQVTAVMKRNEAGQQNEDGDCATCCVWVIYSRKDGLVYEVCHGWPDFLREPAPPEAKTERFYPWFPVVLNEHYLPGDIWPISDVRLLRDAQLEINRARQGLREHRLANRPMTAAAAGVLSPQDRDMLMRRPANAVVELQALQPGQSVADVLQPVSMPGIDPNLYDPSPAFQDILRVTGMQEANLGGTSNATATESSIADASRATGVDAQMDDMDELLTQLARYGGQLLLRNVGQDTVKRIVGPGAVWPVATASEVSEEVLLEVEAGSAGRPNQARELANLNMMLPNLVLIPGISPEWLAKQTLTRMDEKVQLEDAIVAGLPSISAMNQAAGRPPVAPAPGGPDSPDNQGAAGQDNAPRASGAGGMGPRPPEPRNPTAGAAGPAPLNR